MGQKTPEAPKGDRGLAQACDEAIAAQQQQIIACNEALKASQKNSEALKERVEAQDKVLNSTLRKPALLLGVGAASTLVFGPLGAGVSVLLGTLLLQ